MSLRNHENSNVPHDGQWFFAVIIAIVITILGLAAAARNASGQERSVLEVLENNSPIGRATVVAKEPIAEGADGSVGHAITANHVVEDFPLTVGGKFQSFRCRYRSGREIKDCWTIRRDESVDLALIVVWVPKDVEPVPLFDGDVPEADSLTRDWAVRRSRFCVTNGGYRYFDAAIESGESGGPVFRDGCLVGVVSGGWFWMQRDCTECPGLTWPLRAANADRIRLLMEGGDK